jgi:hypothetical protein
MGILLDQYLSRLSAGKDAVRLHSGETAWTMFPANVRRNMFSCSAPVLPSVHGETTGASRKTAQLYKARVYHKRRQNRQVEVFLFSIKEGRETVDHMSANLLCSIFIIGNPQDNSDYFIALNRITMKLLTVV